MDDLDCTPEQRLKGVVSLLKDEAYQWWLIVKQGTQPDRLTWEFFKNAFQGKYMGASYVDSQRREFLNLTQGDKTVAEYEAEFLQLSRYVQEGARFAVLVEKANIAENVKRVERQNCEIDKGRNKRVWEPSGSAIGPKKKARIDGPSRVGASVATFRSQPCIVCGKRHQGECWRGYQQPLRGRGQARGGNGICHGRGAPSRGAGPTEVPYIALLDVGSMHSYIACTVSETLGVMCENTMSKITVLSPLGQSVRVNKLFKDIPLEVQGRIFLADLMELYFGEFNIILGMAWLVKHQGASELSFKCDSALRVEKLVHKGCEAYLAYVCATGFEGSSVKNIRIIKDFSDVFPDELLGLPPNREVRFRIELLPGTALVSIASYRMAPNELVELKAQI
ncbi:uncharacterized protein [Gossypium hirsutum]|uniref:Retrotransposon gag domain-containing protein n=1 Tax=Gossypium hirsutum TaxID=3635 RepID=A0A1U8IG45_GOSHI|nr:uncharacterized protein LOC107894579 [Gossypium hirsutum]